MYWRRTAWLGRVGCILAAGLPPGGAAAELLATPNIVLIMADDLGWGELGSYGQERIETPRLDRLAREGMRFVQAYSGSAVCAPARCSLMTGLHGGHAFIRDNGEVPDPEEGLFGGQTPLPAAAYTMAEMLKARGYSTGCFGKWGLGAVGSSGDPLSQGFDRFFGYNCQRHAHNLYPRYLVSDREIVRLEGNTRGLDGEVYAPQRIADEMLAFVREHREGPFFLYYPTVIPHLPLQVPEEDLLAYRGRWPETPYEGRSYQPHPTPRACYAAMITFMDKQVGRLLDLLDELGIAENTLILFTSDNGTTHLPDQVDAVFFRSVGELRGLKGSFYEGGIRVPLLARWPGRIPAGRVSELPIAHYDIAATVAEVVGADAPAVTDGISFLPALTGRDGEQRRHEYLFWDFAGYGGQLAVRRGDWKAIKRNLRQDPDAPLELYDLGRDPGEARDVAAAFPEVASALDSLLVRARTRPAVEAFRFGRYAEDAVMERIGLGGDGAGFVRVGSGEPFVVWGVNYDHDGDGRLLEDYWDREWARVEEDFREMKALGVNVVRVHLQLGRFMAGPDRLDAAALGRLADLLRLAEETGLYLDVTGLGCYHRADVPEWYDRMGEADRWEVQAAFWRGIARVCAASPAVFCYDLMNEPVVGGGNEEDPGWLAGDFGGKHFVQRIALDLAGRTREEVAEAWTRKLTAAIREEDPDRLITVGVIPWVHVWPKAKPLFYSPPVADHLDFVSVHFYPKAGEVAEALTALAVYDIGKPLVIEEMFPLGCSQEELVAFIDGSRGIAEGWISFYWGVTTEEYASRTNDLAAAITGAWLERFAALGRAGTPDAASKPVDTGGFERGLEGWDGLWTREDGAGRAILVEDDVHGGSWAIRIDHTGERDWSLAQSRRLDVVPGAIYELAAWIRVTGAGDATLGVVTRAADGTVQDWAHGARSVRDADEWRLLRTRFVVPAGVASIQCRLIGVGPSLVLLDDMVLTRQGHIEALRRRDLPAALTLRNGDLVVTVDTAAAAIAVDDLRGARRWIQRPGAESLLVLDAREEAGGLRLQLLDAAAVRELSAFIRLESDRPECVVTVRGEGEMEGALAWPPAFRTAAGQHLILPVNEGISYPVEDPSLSPMRYILYGGHGLCMPWYGVASGEAGWMALVETADDAAVRVPRVDDGLLCLAPEWEPQRGRFGPERTLRYIFFHRGGYVAMAKRYRAHAAATGLLTTLAAKRNVLPAVDRLVGAVNVWCWDDDAPGICREMQAAGIDRILWSNGRPPDELRALNALGVLTSRYDIYQDAMNPEEFPRLRWIHPDWTSEAWANADLMIGADGRWVRGWEVEAKGGGRIPCGTLCDRQAVAYAERRIPPELATHPYRCRFIDTTTASPWRECYHPGHPMTRTESRRYKMELLRYISETCALVCGSETGHDAAVPYVHYFEGMLSLGPYRVPDAGRDMRRIWTEVPERVATFQTGHRYRLPLWELVYHDCVVAQWYWGDYNNKLPALWRRRDLWNVLYGTPPMFMFDRQLWTAQREQFAASYRAIAPVVRAAGYAEMLSHRWLTPDHAVQQTQFDNAVTVTVNFGDTAYTLRDGRVVPPLGFLADGVDVEAPRAR